MKDMLRIMTCGSVDDGKSTLIGHMLWEAGMLKSDQMDVLRDENGTDYALLLDGLSSEREQGITIDVAHRFFETEKRSFIVADTPGHEEYTRNMAVAASTSDLAMLLIDAARGVRIQTRRHLMICSMMGIKDYVFVINKMDLADYSREAFENIVHELESMLMSIGCESCTFIPVSALKGDNLTSGSSKMDWYDGMPLLDYLETVQAVCPKEEGFVMPVQRVSVYGGKRYLQGNIAAGSVHAGDEIVVLPQGAKATVRTAVMAGDAVTLTVEEDIDISRGHVLTAGTELHCTNMFQATVLWMDDKPLLSGRNYLLKLGTRTVNASVISIRYEVEPETGKHLVGRRISKNGIARVDMVCHEDLVFDRFDDHPAMGRFILIDKVTGSTAGCGTIAHPLRRGENLFYHEPVLTRKTREEALGQKARTIWFTGLSGSGKSTLAGELEKSLAASGLHTMLLDGDNIRLGINKDLGFNDYDRAENIRRVAEVSKLMNDAGIIVITAFISPFKEDRRMAREIIGSDSFVEVYVNTPLKECEKRDPKGLYRKARSGEIPNFTGVGSPYEEPDEPDITVTTEDKTVAGSLQELEGYLRELNIVDSK